MFAQRTLQIVIEPDESLIKTIDSFTQVCNSISEIAWNKGKPFKALDLHRMVYNDIKGTISSQLTCTSIRLTAGAYAAAEKMDMIWIILSIGIGHSLFSLLEGGPRC